MAPPRSTDEGSVSSERLCEGLALALVLAQAVAVARMPFVAERFFCWAPHDSRADFVVTARHRGEAVSPDAIRIRYRLPAQEWHSITNVQSVIATAESRMAAADRWEVRLAYRVNLGPEQIWKHGPSE